MSLQLFESELLSEQKHNEMSKEKVPDSKAEIMTTGLEKM